MNSRAAAGVFALSASIHARICSGVTFSETARPRGTSGIMSAILSRHAVTAANGGQEGIDLWRAAEERKEPFAVVVTDLGMPNIDGRKVATAIKTIRPATPVILLTGWGQRMEAEQDLPPHVDRVLNKPPKLNELRSALRDLVAGASPNVSRAGSGQST